MGKWIKKMIKAIYSKLPFNMKTKNEIKNYVYLTFSFALKNTYMYKIWLEQYQIDKEYIKSESNLNSENSKFEEVQDKGAYKEMLMDMYLKSHKKSELFVERKNDFKVNLKSDDIKLIAFYLPQFHLFKENENWWGRGFTEWTNVTKAIPQFIGHHQPQLPIDVGFYDTRLVETQKRQIELAKQYGIYGFCFHHYWFSGKRLMERPVDIFLENIQDLDFPFCLCWANENWTRRWDGMENDVLIAQNHSPENDIEFIKDIQKYINDKRYITVEGKPLIIIYRPQILPDAKATFERWREYCRKSGIGEIYLVGAKSFGFDKQAEFGMDAAVEFPPHTMKCPDITKSINILNPEFKGQVFDYGYFVNEKKYLNGAMEKTFKTVSPAWDNTARKPNNPSIFHGSTPALYGKWLKDCIEYTKNNLNKSEQFVFINAWNEWAEGAHLEPDRKYGYAHLQETANAVIETRVNNKKIIYVSHDAYLHGAQMLSLNIIKNLTEEFHYDVYCILKNHGDLKPEFQKYSKELICVQDDLHGDVFKLKEWISKTGIKKAICNTVVVGDILGVLADCEVECISLIHEMENVIHQYKCENNLDIIAKYAKNIVFASDYVRKSVEIINKIPPNKARIYPQGMYILNPYLNNKDKVRENIKYLYNIENNNKIVLGVGYGDYRKGIDLFVDTAYKTLSIYSNVTFIWVGKIELELKNNLEKTIKDKGYEKSIIFAGFQNDSMKYYIASDVFLLTSREDPFPTVVMEAMYAKLPVIAFKDGGGYVEIINDENGKLVEYENVEQMSNELVKYLYNEINLSQSGVNAHKFVCDNFDFKSYIYSLLDLLEEKYKKVSVIIPNYNYGKYLKERIDSILNQTYPIYEIIILDDCSTDGSINIIEEYKEKYQLLIKVCKNTINSGNVFNQWEKGISMASGDFIWIAEADDLCKEDFAEKMIIKFDDPNVVMAYCQSEAIDENGNKLSDNYLEYTNSIDNKIWLSDYVSEGKTEISKRLSVKNTILNVSSVIFKNTDFSKHIDIARNYTLAGDWALYISLLNEGGKIAFISKSLNIHRRHKDSVTGAMKAQKHFNEICEVQDYAKSVSGETDENNKKIYEYRKELKIKFSI